MSNEFKQAILEGLRKKMKQTTDQFVFDRMDSVERALRRWDGAGEPLYADELRQWGVLPALETPAAEPQQVEPAQPGPPEAEPAAQMVGMESPTAQLEDTKPLEAILEPVPELPTAQPEQESMEIEPAAEPAGDLAQEPPIQQVEPEPLPQQPEPPAPVEVEQPLPEPVRAEMPKPVTVEEPAAPPPDPDSALREALEQARRLMQDGKYFDARTRLEKLLAAAVTPDFKQAVNGELMQVIVELQRQTNALVEAAQRAEREFADNLDVQEEAWARVKETNPEDVRAITAIERLGRQRAWRAAEAELRDIERRVAEAKTNDNLPLMNTLRGRVEALYNQAARGDLPEELGQQVMKLNREFKREYDQMRLRLGVGSTKKVEGDLKGSYLMGRKYLEAATPVIIDTANDMGKGAGAEVDAEEFFILVSREYINNLKDLAGQRLESAKTMAPGDPEGARTLLEDALRIIAESGLTVDDMGRLDREKQQLEEALKEVNHRLDRFRRADALANDARFGKSAQRKLELLTQAKGEYAEYPGLEMLFQQANDELADTYGRELDQDTLDAESLAKKESYPEAVDWLRESRKRVTDIFTQPKPGSRLDAAVQHSLQVETRVLADQADYQQMLATIAEADQMLAEFDQTKSREKISQAWIRYNRLSQHASERIRKHDKLMDLHAKLTARQSSGDNFDAGEAAYSRGEWQPAEDALNKVGSDFPRYAEAQLLAARARAARFVEDARKHESEKKWTVALGAYRAAIYLVDGNTEQNIHGIGADAFILNLIQTARQKVLDLAPIEEVNRRHKDLMDEAETTLEKVKKGAAIRIETASKVQPLKLSDLGDKIRKALQERSDHYYDLQRLQNDLYALWREIYMDGIRAALASASLALVADGRSLAKELDRFGLINTDPDHVLNYKLESLELDLAVIDWMALDPTSGEPQTLQPLREEARADFAELERNRERRSHLLTQLKRLGWTPEMAQEAGGERYLRWSEKVIQSQLRYLRRRRILLHIDRLRRETDASRSAPDRGLDGLLKAQRYLEEQLNSSPGLATDPELIRDLVEYYWQTGLIFIQIQADYQDASDALKAKAAADKAAAEWEKAEIAAKRLDTQLIGHGPEQAEAWKNLTRLSRAFAELQIDKGQAVMESLSGRFSAIDALVQQKMQEIKDETLNRLIREADTASGQASPVKLLQAATRYSMANQLDLEKQQEAVITQGLQGLGQRIEPVLTARCAEAKALRIGSRPLSQALSEAEAIYQVLDDIQEVAGALGLSKELNAQLEDALDALGKRKQRWQNFSENQKIYDASLKEALSAPVPVLQDDGSERFEWSFADPQEKMKTLQGMASTDDELPNLYNSLRTALEKFDQDALDMLARVQAFMKAVQDEAFDQVNNPDPDKDLGKIVESAWAGLLKRDPRWGGLTLLLEYDYSPFFIEPVSTVTQHKTCAALQQANHNEWTRWAESADSKYKSAVSDGELLAKNLPELVREISLEEIIAKCRQAMSSGGAFIAELGKKPTAQPLSKKAVAQKARVPDSNQITVQDTQARARELEPLAVQQKQKLEWGSNAPLGRLRRQMEAYDKALRQNRGLENARAAAEVALRFCEELDPCNAYVVDARRKIRLGF